MPIDLLVCGVNLFPLINDRVFGEWNAPSSDNNNSNNPLTSPRDAFSSPSSVSSSPLSSPSINDTNKQCYVHLDDGWLSLYTSPATQQQRTNNNNGPNSPMMRSPPQQQQRTTQSTTTTTLENDPIVRLLRAPRKKSLCNNNTYVPPTLLDAISAESIHRPSIKFKLPLGMLDLVVKACVDDWEVVYWNEINKEKNMGMGSGGVGRGGGGQFGSPQHHQSDMATRDDHQKELLIQMGKVGKENATRILLHLLRSPGGLTNDYNNTQLELRTYFQMTYAQQRNQNQSTGGQQRQQQQQQLYTTPLKPRTMMMGIGNNNNTPNMSMEPCLNLTMLEYYLFLFVRYPLANSNWVDQSAEHARRRRMYDRRALGPYGQRVYSYLLSSYLNYYVGQNGVYDESTLCVGVDCFDGASIVAATTSEDVNHQANSNNVAGGGGIQQKSTAMERTSELFLRLLIEFWIEGSNVALPTVDATTRYRRVRSGMMTSVSSSSSQTAIRPTLRDSLELAQPSSAIPFTSPPMQVQNYILTIVRHLVSDRSMRELVQKVSGVVQARQKEDRQGSTNSSVPNLVNEGSNNMTSASSTSLRVSWPLPPAMTAVQPSLFNYIRLGLACGAIHDRTSIFHRALETWLIWLEPWNYVLKRRVFVTNRQGSANAGSGTPSGGTTNGGGGGGRRGAAGEFLRNAAATVSSHHRVEYVPSYVQPKPTSPSTYTSQWEAYVVSNAHYFTVPLAIFLKRARELDFSSTVEYPRSLALVQRVLRVYSKGVVNVLNGVLNSRADGLSMSLFSSHGVNMGAYCPPTTNWKLADCQLDATNLLEEVFSQYQKRKAAMDIFDRLEAKLNGLFSGKIGSDEAALESLLANVRLLVNLPLDYQVLPEEPRISHGFGLLRFLGLSSKDTTGMGSSASDNFLVPERGPDGKLTDLGRQQLYAGLVKCGPMVQYIGDPMLARVKSYEIPAVVELTICASNYLNRKLDLVPPIESGTDGEPVEEDDALLKKYQEMERYQKIKFRVNLRFLADSRNIIFATVLWWIVTSIRGLFSN